MKFEINKCEYCKSKNIHQVDDGFIICLDCKAYADFMWTEGIDRLSFWIYKKEIMNKIRKREKAK